MLLISDIWGVLKKETRFLPNELKQIRRTVPEISGFLFGGLTVLISVEELKHACHLDL